MTDLNLHRAWHVEIDGPLRIMIAVPMPLEDMTTLSTQEGQALAVALLDYLPRLTIHQLIDTLLTQMTGHEQAKFLDRSDR